VEAANNHDTNNYDTIKPTPLFLFKLKTKSQKNRKNKKKQETLKKTLRFEA